MHHEHEDFYKGKHGYPDLRSHASAYYVEPDYIANEVDDQLPILSTIGRGPKGKGITAKIKKSTETEFIFDVIDDEFGEVIFESANLHGGKIWVSQPINDHIPGAVSSFDVHIQRGKSIQTYPVDINPGAQGSRIYALSDKLDIEDDGLYRVDTNKLSTYKSPQFEQFLTPRVNDVVLFCGKDEWKVQLLAGAILETDEQETTLVASPIFTYPLPVVGEDGYWWLGDEKTDIKIDRAWASEQDIANAYKKYIKPVLKKQVTII